MNIYAVGDIHGCHDQLTRLLDQIERHAAGGPYRGIFLGDYVDRGPDARSVVRDVRALVAGGRWTALKGNHEEMMIEALAATDRKDRDFWLDHGGREAAASYGGDEAAMREDAAWLATLPTMIETAHHIFVHAGLDPRHPLDQQSDRTRMWIRGWEHAHHDFGKHIVYGHTPQDAPLLLAHSTGLDTGAYRGGPLTAALFDDMIAGGPLALLEAR